MHYQYITVEGNIGAGKTTLVNLLASRLKGRMVLEQFADNPFLPQFYENPAQYAFPLELFFMAERYKQLKEMIQSGDLFRQPTFSDYLFIKSLLFAKINLAEEEFRLYQRLFDILHPSLVQPDLLIYLHAPVPQLLENIRKRGRSYEQRISTDYLLRLQETYVQYIRQHRLRTLMIDVSKADYEHDHRQLALILDALERDYDFGVHYLRLE